MLINFIINAVINTVTEEKLHVIINNRKAINKSDINPFD